MWATHHKDVSHMEQTCLKFNCESVASDRPVQSIALSAASACHIRSITAVEACAIQVLCHSLGLSMPPWRSPQVLKLHAWT